MISWFFTFCGCLKMKIRKNGAFENICSLLDQNAAFPPTLIVLDDSIAFDALKAFQEHGIVIPDDLSIIRFDNISLSGMANSPLTTMEVPCKEMGIGAVRFFCEHIPHPFSAKIQVQFSTKLLVRGSIEKS